MVFETKKIQSETLGEYLKAVRLAFNFSLSAAAEGARVNPKFLEALEQGKLLELPADVYVQGILNQLALFYKLEGRDLISQYKKEIEIQRRLKQEEKFSKKKLFIFWKKIIITPRVLALITAGIFIFLTLGYLFWQVSSINRTPGLVILSPGDQQIINSLSVKVSGETDPGAVISVNGQEIFVDNQGKFSAQISLAPGAQEIKTISKNRFGKQVQKTIKVFIEAQKAAAESGNDIVLTLVFSGSGNLTFSADGGEPAQKAFKPGESIEIKAMENITLSASDGGLVAGNFQGQSLGLLGKPGEPLNNVSFSKESANIK